MGFTLSSSAFAIPSIAFSEQMHLNSVDLFHQQLPWWEILAIGYHFHFHMSDLRYFLKPYFLCRGVHHMWDNSGHNPDPLSDYFINMGLDISPMAYSWLRQWAHTKMEKLPPECVPIATALIILKKTVSTDTPSHIGTQWLWTKSPADWLTRTVSRLSTRWVWAKGCIYFRGIYGPCCAPATHTSTSQDTRPQGLQVAAHGKRAGWDKVRRCRV